MAIFPLIKESLDRVGNNVRSMEAKINLRFHLQAHFFNIAHTIDKKLNKANKEKQQLADIYESIADIIIDGDKLWGLK